MGLLCALALASAPAAVAATPDCADRAGQCPQAEPAPREDFQPAAAERWIEVDLESHEVLLRSGSDVLQRVPAATGRNDTPWTTTYSGLFRVYSKSRDLSYLPQQGVYIRDWVGFDSRWYNGFHSFPLNGRGGVLDGRVGQDITNGCVRTGASDAIYRFAQIGMRVLIRGDRAPARSLRQGPSRWLLRAV